MDLPVIQVYDLLVSAAKNNKISDAGFIDSWGDPSHIYVNNIPPTANEHGETAVALIRESNNEPADYANNRPKNQLVGVELQLFFNVYSRDVQRTELQVQKVMLDAGWRLAVSRPHTWDPDTNWLTKTMYFEKTETLKDEDFK